MKLDGRYRCATRKKKHERNPAKHQYANADEFIFIAGKWFLFPIWVGLSPPALHEKAVCRQKVIEISCRTFVLFCPAARGVEHEFIKSNWISRKVESLRHTRWGFRREMAMSAGSEGGSSPEFVSELFFDEEGEKKEELKAKLLMTWKGFTQFTFRHAPCRVSSRRKAPHTVCLVFGWLACSLDCQVQKTRLGTTKHVRIGSVFDQKNPKNGKSSWNEVSVVSRSSYFDNLKLEREIDSSKKLCNRDNLMELGRCQILFFTHQIE